MPSKGAALVTGQTEVVLPFEKKVKEILTLVDQTPEQKESDKKFLKDDKPATVSGNELEVLNACLSAVTVLSFLGGPEGIIVASGIVLFQGVLNVFAHEGKQDSLTTMKNVLEKIQNQNQISEQLGKVKAIANMVENQWKTNVDNPDASAEEEKRKIDKELTAETGAGADSLGKTLFNMEDKMEWDNTGVRVCILASLTYYFVLWNLQCRIWASFAQIEAAKGDKMDLARYESFVTTFRIRVRDMKAELNARSSKVRQLYKAKKEARVAQIELFPPQKQNAPAFAENNNITTYVKFTDHYTGKEYSTTVPMKWWAHYSSQEQIDEVKAAKDKEFAQYKSDLEDFATRAIAGDLKVVDQWADIVQEAELLLLPPAPKVPATIDHYQPTEKDKVHQYLKDARWISYAYSVGTSEDGDSAPSPWTDWIELKTDGDGKILLPVLALRDSNQVVKTRRTIWHRKETQEKTAAAAPEPMPKDKFQEEWKSEIIVEKGSVLWVES